MFPPSHDIVPENLDVCLQVLNKLLKTGNDVLIVSKPRIQCVEKMCQDLKCYKNQIEFRFTIGAIDNVILKFWEPGASTYEERKQCLEYVLEKGFQASVSVEPMLDLGHIDDLIWDLAFIPLESVWIGKMTDIMRIKRPVNPKFREIYDKQIEGPVG